MGRRRGGMGREGGGNYCGFEEATVSTGQPPCWGGRWGGGGVNVCS